MTDRLAGLALAALAVLTVVLVGVAVERQTGLGGRDAEASGPTSGRTDTGRDSAATPTDPEPTSEAPVSEALERTAARVTDGRDGLLAYAAARETCRPDGPPAELVVVHDSDTTRTTVEGITVVTGIQVVDDDTLRVVGGDTECVLAAMTSDDRGETWAVDTPGFWSLVPGDDTGLVHASGKAGVPCPAISVSGVDPGVARVLCDDGRVLGTADAGVEWVVLGDVADARAISFASPAAGYAVVEAEGCDGATVNSTVDGGTSWVEVACVDLPGPWGISVNDGLLLVAGSGGHRTSTDGGASWS